MNSWITPIVTSLIAGLFGALITYFFSLRKDREERRRERIISHLIEAYKNIVNASCRTPLSESEEAKLETSIAAILLFGSKPVVLEAEKFVGSMDAGALL